MLTVKQLRMTTLPSLRRLAASDYGMLVRRRIMWLFPAYSSVQHEMILRGFFRYRLLNRIIYRLTMLNPQLAAIASRCVPIAGRARMAQANAHHGPVIVASAHFGSLYWMSFMVARALRGRRLYFLHKNTIADASRNEVFLRRRGIIPVAADERGLLMLVRALQDDPNTAIMLAFDAPARSRYVIPFLAMHIPVSTGVGMLADIGRCPVVPWFWQYNGWLPSVSIAEPIFADPSLPAVQRRNAVAQALYALLEERVGRMPEQWQLDFISEPRHHARAPASRHITKSAADS